MLAAQVEAGQKADVFAGASPKYPEELQGEEAARPDDELRDKHARDRRAGVESREYHDGATQLVTKQPTLVVGDPTVPIGSYTEEVLGNLGIDESQLNIVSKEVDTKSVLAKVTTGAADAGFVYVTDALAAGSAVKQVKLPEVGAGDRDLSDRRAHGHRQTNRRRNGGSPW